MRRCLLTLSCLMLCLTLRSQSLYTCRYWFDKNHGELVEATFEGNSFQIELETNSLSAGLHTLFLMLQDTSGVWCSPQTYLFYNISAEFPTNSNNTVCHFWYDQGYANRQTMPFGTGQFLLDTDNIDAGVHLLNVMLDYEGLTSTEHYLFFKASEENPINPSDVVCHYWYDQNFTNIQSVPYGTGQFLLDTESLSDGLHTLHLSFDSDGTTPVESFMFYKVPAPIDPLNPEDVIYHCWFDEDFEHKQTGTFQSGQILLNARLLSEGTHIVNIMLERGSFTSVQRYSFEKYFVNGRTIIALVNPMGAGTVTGAMQYEQGDTCTLVATPSSEMFDFVNWTNDGIVVSDSTTHSFVVTEDATYTANFDWQNPSSVDYVTEGLIMYFDGIYNTRNGHDTTATVWEDLMGNYDLPITNYSSYTWEDNHFIGFGNGGYLNTGKTWKYFNSLNDDLTIEIVTYIDCDKTTPSWRGIAGWHSGSDGTNIQNDQGGSRMQTLGALPVTEADDMISTISYTRNNGSFLNGSWKIHDDRIRLGVNSNYTAVFGNSYSQSRGWNDSIYCIRMYNRSLSPEEVAYNHNVDVERFGASSSVWFGIVATANPTNGGIITGAGTYEEGQQCTLTATANPDYTFINWTENGYQVSTDPNYSFTVTGYRSLVANFVQTQVNAYIISAMAQPVGSGTISGGGGYAVGSTCTLRAMPAEGYFFQNWTKNGVVVSYSPTYSFTVTESANYVANFTLGLPELHVTGITHSEMMGGQPVTISWTVQNDGTASTPNGEIWHDRVWLSVESRVAADDNNPILLGTFDNLSALNPGEYYTQTQTFTLPLELSGSYYLFVLTDAYDCHTIYWGSGGVPLPYSPPPYLGCLSHHCYSGCPNVADNRILELSEFEYGNNGFAGGLGYYSDNFFYELVDIAIPNLPDLQVTSVVAPEDFIGTFDISEVSITATISNTGVNDITNSQWFDNLYMSSNPEGNPAFLVGIHAQSGSLGVGESYQVDEWTSGLPPPMSTNGGGGGFGGSQTMHEGHAGLMLSGDVYFFVYSDGGEDIYERLENNNIAVSNVMHAYLNATGDLEPSDLTVPDTVSTGEFFSYSYKVYNNGAGEPYGIIDPGMLIRDEMTMYSYQETWWDKIYLCQNADTLDATAVLLKKVRHTGGLLPGTYYSVSESMVLPSGITLGNYYLYVLTDADNVVFEYQNESNNLARSNAITIVRPDLQVTLVSAPEQITMGYPLNISYTLANAGEGSIINREVTDRVCISASGNLADTIGLASIKHNVYLPAGQSLTMMCNDLAPFTLTGGTYHLVVVTDCGHNINESNEGNNTGSLYPISVAFPPMPDLEPVSLTLPELVQAGTNIPVQFNVTNNGDLDLLNSNCTFDVYALMGEEEILCPVQSQTLPLGNYVSIGMGQTLHFARTVHVPPTVTSACSTFELVVNKGNLVPELDTTNNVFTTIATVLDCPLPDLMVSNVSLPTLQAGTETLVSFVVNNNGEVDFSGTFGTDVYAISATDTILCPMILQLEPEDSENYSIALGTSLQFTQKLLVPPSVTSAHTFFSVVVDEENEVLEINEANNATHVDALVIDYPFNLATQTFEVPSTVIAGEATSVSWTVKNTGTCPNEQIPFYVSNENGYALVEGEFLPTSWMDMIMLSNDTVLSDDDIFLLAYGHNTVAHPNDTYTVECTVSLPYSSVGSRYLICVSDSTQVTFDNHRSDNILAVPVEVELGVLPDLHLTEIVVEPNITADNSYWVRYTITNEGERVTQRDSWVDAIYISETYTLVGAFQLGSKIHTGALEIGASYTDSIEILAPNSIVGDFFLLGYTDVTNQIYENTNEGNNLLGISVSLEPAPPCDLIALQPEFPTSVVSGADLTVSWRLRNIGLNPAMGRIRNAVYLSTDAAWSSDDKMLGYADIDVNIAANGQKLCQLSGSITDLDEGRYYVIVKVNILNALNESTYENNVQVSMMPIQITFPILAIGETIHRYIEPERYNYYKIEVGQEYEGQALLCRMVSHNHDLSVANEIYLSHEFVPTPMDFDYGAFVPYSYEQEIIIPSLEQGTYYLMAQGAAFHEVDSFPILVTHYDNRYIDTVSAQQISLSTSIINFEILSIHDDHGSNTGSFTTKVTGAKFEEVMDIRLVQGDNYQPAQKTFFNNSTETYVTFNLTDLPLGTYSMEAELPGGVITVKENAFTIEEGLPAELHINIIKPSSVRRGNTFPVTIEFSNVGTTDLNVEGLVVMSRNGHPVGFTSEELLTGQTSVGFYTSEENGNPGIMRPGYNGAKAILVKATNVNDVNLVVYAIRRQN